MLLEVANLDVRYGRNHAVKGLNLSVAADELIAVLGANGAGKTSLLRAIQGLIPISDGFIRFDGEDISRLSPPERLKRQLVLVPEGRQIVIGLSVHENLQMGAYCRADAGVPRDIEAIYERFPNLAARRKMPASVLSGGEQQRLAIARSILLDAPILVLDEATAFADPDSEAAIQRAITELVAGRTLVVIAHRLHTITGADRILMLENGEVTEAGTHEELVAAGKGYATMWARYQTAQAGIQGEEK